jgi:phosphoribosylformylglycinamidine (FGAM) synthase PurS component
MVVISTRGVIILSRTIEKRDDPTRRFRLHCRHLPLANGRYSCELKPSLEGQTGPKQITQGQNRNHALAIALEKLAFALRTQAEAEQEIDWDAVDRSASGKVLDKRFHVIVHYERVAAAESKFEAMHDTLLGNTVVENAEIAILQVDADLPIAPLACRLDPS